MSDLIEASFVIECRADVPAGIEWALSALGNTTVVAILPDDRKTPSKARWLCNATLAAVAGWASALNSSGWNLYFHVNEPKEGLNKKASKSDITRLRGVFADVDFKDSQTPETAWQVIATLPQPDIIIASGGGFQPIWKLIPPLSSNPSNVARAEAIGTRIATVTKGDGVQNVDRILRLPFSVNYPNAAKVAEGRIVCLSGIARASMPE